MFGSCVWPWLSRAWTCPNNSATLPTRRPLGPPAPRTARGSLFLLLLLTCAVLVPPRGVLGQTTTASGESYDEVEDGDQLPLRDQAPQQHTNHDQTVPLTSPHKMVDGGAVSKVSSASFFLFT